MSTLSPGIVCDRSSRLSTPSDHRAAGYSIAFGSLIAFFCVVAMHRLRERIRRESVIHKYDPPLSSLLPWSKLTPHEIATILYSRCPDCMDGSLIPGPCAGAGQNVACGACGDEFTVCELATELSVRNNPKGIPNAERLRTTYGVTLVYPAAGAP